MTQQNIRVGLIGMGAMGKGLLYQCSITPGIECVAVADIDAERCAGALSEFGLSYESASPTRNAEAIIAANRVAVLPDGDSVARCQAVDVVIEGSSGVASAIEHCITTLQNGKHLVLMNSEIDLTYGPLLSRIARQHGVVSTSCGGDQYGVLKELLDEIEGWGFQPVMAGNIKGFLDRYANPTSIVFEADKRKLDYRMCTSYTDGSKLNVEMAIIANALGMMPARIGMLGPPLDHVSRVFDVFDFDALWKNRTPVVDYVLGAEPGGGVFAIGYCEHPYQRDMLAYYKMGNGPFYLFYRPYHLCHIEALKAVTMAARDGQVFLEPALGMRTNVYAYAKKDLKPGDMLDGLGGYAAYGLVETVESDAANPGVPICLAEDLQVKSPIRKDQKILLADLIHDPGRADFRRYAEALALSAN